MESMRHAQLSFQGQFNTFLLPFWSILAVLHRLLAVSWPPNCLGFACCRIQFLCRWPAVEPWLVTLFFLPRALWFIGDLAFHSNLKILPLKAYDIIIGMDWLESFSPMTVHWQQKWLQIPYGDQTVLL